jgi:flagellar basal body rod protein FlgG
MDPLLIAAASGMKARMESLDMLANNIANSGTSGFKADREAFTLLAADLPLIERHWTDFSQGTLLPTANPLDLALEGPGFFALNGPNGVVYTRSGHFEMNGARQLAAPGGFTLRNARDPQRGPIVVDPAVAVEIDREGVVRQAGVELGQIETASVPDAAEALAKLGGSYFALLGGRTAAPSRAELRQGTLEQSNVSPGEASVRLVSLLRQFEMLQRALSLGAEMNRRAIEEVARVS